MAAAAVPQSHKRNASPPREVRSPGASAPAKRPCCYAAGHAHQLPVDLLAALFEFIPLLPRLRVASLVCRRWRTAALRSVTALAVAVSPDQPGYHSFLSIFPSLRELTVRTAGGTHVALPAQLETLTIDWDWHFEGTSLAITAFPTALRSLAQRGGYDNRHALLYECVHAARTSLTALDFKTGCIFIDSPHAERLAATHLPHLTSLCIRNDHNHDAPPWLGLDFVRLHATQLRSLDLVYAAYPAHAMFEFFQIHFPDLRTFKWRAASHMAYVDTEEAEALSKLLIRRMPHLTDLHVKGPPSLLAPRLHPLVRTLECRGEGDATNEEERAVVEGLCALRSFCGLSGSLVLYAYWPDAETVPAQVQAKLTCFTHYKAYAPRLDWATMAFRMRRLDSHVCDTTELPPPLPLPSLRTVHISAMDMRRTIALLNHLLTHAPSLRKVSVLFCHPPPEAHAAEWQTLTLRRASVKFKLYGAVAGVEAHEWLSARVEKNGE